MNRFRRAARRTVFAASLALTLTVALMPSGKVSSAAAYYSYQITYYSDATYTQVVGSRFVDCNGRSRDFTAWRCREASHEPGRSRPWPDQNRYQASRSGSQ